MDRAAVIGVGQTPFAQRREDRTYAELVYEAATAALADAGLTIADIDNIVTTSNDFWDGRTISSMAVGDAAGAAFGDGKNISTVEGDGTMGAFYGLARTLSGGYRTSLVVAHGKASEGDQRLITNAFCDPLTERALGLDAVTAAALQARAFAQRSGTTPEDWARVVAKNRARGARNPNAQLRAALSLAEALASAEVAPPLRALDLAPPSDGAAAIILAGEEFARERSARPVWVEGVALCAEAPLGHRDLGEAPALRLAAARAYRMAGVSDPAREIDAAELSEHFSFQELLWARELGGLPPERINRSGGCLCANAPIAAGLVRLIEAARQLRGDAVYEAPPARRALAHGQYGLCGASHCVWILGSNG